MAEWAPIEVADALELLSPDFKNDEVTNLPTWRLASSCCNACAWGQDLATVLLINADAH